MMVRRYCRRGCAALALPGVLLCLAVLHPAVASPAFDVRATERVLERLLPQHSAQFDLRAIEGSNGHELCRISAADGHIRIEGSTPSALLFGVNWYLNPNMKIQVNYVAEHRDDPPAGVNGWINGIGLRAAYDF